MKFAREHFLPSIKFDHSYSIQNLIHHLNAKKRRLLLDIWEGNHPKISMAGLLHGMCTSKGTPTFTLESFFSIMFSEYFLILTARHLLTGISKTAKHNPARNDKPTLQNRRINNKLSHNHFFVNSFTVLNKNETYLLVKKVQRDCNLKW
jgi:hypothetical protein